MIPKIIHYCWFGRGLMPHSQKKCIEGWKRLMPDYTFMRWDESTFDYTQYPAARYGYETKKYALVSDVCRYNVLAQYGGIYLDTDVELFERLDRFLDYNFFSGIELYHEFETEHIAERYLNADGTPKVPDTDIPHMEILTSSMACNPGNEMICAIRDYYNSIDADADWALHYREHVNNDRLVARYLTKYGFRYVNETQYLHNNMVVFGTGVFGHAFCPDERNEVSLHHNAASWLPKKQRDNTFDIMKGIGILSVLLGHVWELHAVNHFIASFHMPLFFIVAGIFAHSYKQHKSSDIPQMIGKYARRLILPFVVTTISTILTLIVLALVNGKWNAVMTQFLSLFWADVCHLSTPFGAVSLGVVWFLLALFWAKVFLLFLSRWERWVLPISFALSIFALLLHNLFPYSIWCFSIGLVSLPFVAIGWWIRNRTLPWWVFVICVLSWIIANRYSSMDMYSYLFAHYPLDVIGACGGTFCVYLLSRMINKVPGRAQWVPKSLAYLGRISLAIMCVHGFEIITHLGSHVIALTPWAPLPLWGLYVFRYVLTILLAIIVIHTPYLKKIFA